jgi:hypothetical protein
VRRTPGPFASTALAGVAALAPLAPLAPLTSAGCSRGEPPTWEGGSLSVAPLPLLSPPTLPSPADGARTDAAATDAAVDAGPAVDPGTLPQTRDRPHEGAPFQARAAALWDAIVRDDADAGLAFFFPVSAYRQVKAIATPETDWKRRLVANFRRDIHRLHEKLGARVETAKLVELEVATERGHWVEPGEEGNKLGYWRVYGSKLRYETDRGASVMEVSSLISWRGEWYVVHLSGFR